MTTTQAFSGVRKCVDEGVSPFLWSKINFMQYEESRKVKPRSIRQENEASFYRHKLALA